MLMLKYNNQKVWFYLILFLYVCIYLVIHLHFTYDGMRVKGFSFFFFYNSQD